MKTLKNIVVGFAVSYIGSIPLGYLNVIGFNIYAKSGMGRLTEFLSGVVIIEAIVIFGTLVFADKLTHNTRLIKYIELFSIFFMLIFSLDILRRITIGKCRNKSAYAIHQLPTFLDRDYYKQPEFHTSAFLDRMEYIPH
ncbi:hypothetical protein [Flavobacterium sp. 3HN19-14]|uniref:hypothetical protein n=1 Tax=Flavobacterium sp. 3HN19-14 TaxID=3448133 RepID=UPI003EE082F2